MSCPIAKLDVATFYSQPKFFVGSKLAVKAGATICAQDLVCTGSSPCSKCYLAKVAVQKQKRACQKRKKWKRKKWKRTNGNRLRTA